MSADNGRGSQWLIRIRQSENISEQGNVYVSLVYIIELCAGKQLILKVLQKSEICRIGREGALKVCGRIL